MCAHKASKTGKPDMITDHNPEKAGAASLPPVTAGLEPELQDHIGRQLRAVYDEVLNEPVPDRFLRLLAELERKQAEKS